MAEARSVGHLTFQAVYLLLRFYCILLVVHNAKDYELQQNLCVARVRSQQTPVHYTMILGMLILPVPTQIGFLK